MQDELIRITAQLLKESDDLHNAGQSTEITVFPANSFVLVAQRTTPETRMHTKWRGPLKVTNRSYTT